MRRRSHCCLSQSVRRLLMVAALIACSPVIAWGANPPAAAASEADPYVAAAKDAGVPLQVLIAVAGAESAYHPWALDIEGRQVFCRSRAQAETVLANTATTNVDIGLMQINWRFWGPRSGVASKGDLLDPRKNLELGAAILKEGLSRGGSLWHRISNYHMGGAAERGRYNKLVYDAYLKYMHGKIGRGMIR
jgi:soluble lytic murein transglycosylase-like protein